MFFLKSVVIVVLFFLGYSDNSGHAPAGAGIQMASVGNCNVGASHCRCRSVGSSEPGMRRAWGMSDKTGGQAFPRNADIIDPGAEGMTLRDYFAAKVLQAIVDVSHSPELFANHAHKVADAMLEARNK